MVDVEKKVVAEINEFFKFVKGDKENRGAEVRQEEGIEEQNTSMKQSTKRKRKNEEYIYLEDILSIFLRIFYPLSKDMKKFAVVGLNKVTGCKPVVMINQTGKTIVLNETAWDSFYKRMQLIDCYLSNKIFGKKTSFTLLASDIEIDIIILRGEQYVRIREVSKHDLKVQLTYEEFSMLYRSSAAINNYINQLHIVEKCCEDYVNNTIDELPTSQILYSPLDTSIMNRLPQEVELYRRMIMSNTDVNDNRKLQEETEELEPESDGSVIEINSQETDI